MHEIIFAPDHVFLYPTPLTAYIIPRRELGDALFLEVSSAIRFRSIPDAAPDPRA